MSMEEELPLKELNPEQDDISQDEPIEVCVEDLDNCQKCQTSKIDKMYIPGQDVLHCICTRCGYEWVE